MPFNPKLTISLPIAKSISSIERTRGFFEAANFSQDWLSKMQARAFFLEAHHTTHIEGTCLSLDQSQKLITGEKISNVDDDDVQQLLNYKTAFDFAEDHLSSQGVITEGFIREIHYRLLNNVKRNSAQPGQYRLTQNYLANAKTKEIIYTPPPVHDIPLLMAELVNWIQNEQTIPGILLSGIAQFQLVHIHPFLDGNEKTARLLSTLCLYRSGYDFKKLFTLSEYYDRNRQDYYNAIQSVRNNDMDMTHWLEYYCQALEAQIQEIRLKGSRAMHLDVLTIEHKLSNRQKQALEHLVENGEEFSIDDYALLSPDTNRRTLQRDLSSLISKGLIIPKGQKKETRYRINIHR